MKTLSMTLAALSLSGLCNLALADGNPLSVHVLNLENGLPSAGVNVTLEQHVGDKWQSLSEGVTNQQGRIAELFPQGGTVTVEDLVAKGAVRPKSLVKVLGQGDISVKLDVTVDAWSESAKTKIEAAGGSVSAR